jgi:hypothetical protein
MLRRRPRTITCCNCSLCRRYAALWAYYPPDDVVVRASAGACQSYRWGPRSIRFVRCRGCGCVTHWQAIRPGDRRRMGVNVRNAEPAALVGIRVRHLDGAASWKYLD